jgi:hypothetical protein
MSSIIAKPMSKVCSCIGPFLVGSSRPDDVRGSPLAFGWFGVGIDHGYWSSIDRSADDALKLLVFVLVMCVLYTITKQ